MTLLANFLGEAITYFHQSEEIIFKFSKILGIYGKDESQIYLQLFILWTIINDIVMYYRITNIIFMSSLEIFQFSYKKY